MKMKAEWEFNLNIDEVIEITREATIQGLRDTIVPIQEDAMRGSPKKTGNNMRSLAAEVATMGSVAGSGHERVVDDNKLEAAVYSTSGYGGHLEVGTNRMAARPYIRPAFDLHKNELAENIKKNLK